MKNEFLKPKGHSNDVSDYSLVLYYSSTQCYLLRVLKNVKKSHHFLKQNNPYLPGKMFEIFSVANAAQFAVRLSVRIKALYNKLWHLGIQGGKKQQGKEKRKQQLALHYTVSRSEKYTSLRKTSLLFFASSLEVSASAVLVENCNHISRFYILWCVRLFLHGKSLKLETDGICLCLKNKDFLGSRSKTISRARRSKQLQFSLHSGLYKGQEYDRCGRTSPQWPSDVIPKSL